ncbi:MAG: hypothetical protein SF187_26010 [Deltaproteobacteria bacterium]|nr:hypothetical protein [Deltaproteobacteria bacterium]
MTFVHASLAFAAPVQVAASVEGMPRPTVGFGLGPAVLLKSQSHAVSHLIKPLASLYVRWPWRERFEFGAQAVALADDNQHYRVLGALGQARWQAWARGVFSTGFAAGLGAGHDADILHANLQGGGISVYGTAGVDARWNVGSRWAVAAEVDTLNLATVRLAACLSVRF